jgi:hypothetical protein
MASKDQLAAGTDRDPKKSPDDDASLFLAGPFTRNTDRGMAQNPLIGFAAISPATLGCARS